MKKEYSIKNGFQLTIPAQVIGQELEKINVKYGIIEPQVVIKEAKPKKSTLHSCFEWDDSIAAEKYREDQARYIIRAIDVTIIENYNTSEPIKAFVHLKELNESGYRQTTDVMGDKRLRELLLKQAFEELQYWSKRYTNFIEFAQIFKIIETFKQKIPAKQGG